MAQILVKINDQSGKPQHFKHGDPLVVREDDHVWGRYESRDVWVTEGLAGVDPEGVDRSGQTAANWPGGFLVLRLTGTTASQVIQYVQNHADGVQERAYKIDTSGINLSNGSITATRAQVIARVSLKAAQ